MSEREEIDAVCCKLESDLYERMKALLRAQAEVNSFYYYLYHYCDILNCVCQQYRHLYLYAI